MLSNQNQSQQWNECMVNIGLLDWFGCNRGFLEHPTKNHLYECFALYSCHSGPNTAKTEQQVRASSSQLMCRGNM